MRTDNIDYKIEIAKNRYDIINQSIINSDTKSSILLAFYGVLLTLVFTSPLLQKISRTLSFEPLIDSERFFELRYCISVVALLAFIILSFLCLFFIYQTLRARVKIQTNNQLGLVENSNIYFQKICNKPYSDFHDAAMNESLEDYLNDMNSQIYICSIISSQKFKAYNKSLLFGFLGILSIGVYLLTA